LVWRSKSATADFDRGAGVVVSAFLSAALLCAALELGGCANGDFGRVKPGFVYDDIHAWVGATAAQGSGTPISNFPLTDDERALRDLAYPLIEPPYDRQRWYGFLNEYGIGRIFRDDWSRFDAQAYARALAGESLRSESARYARLGDDIRNDLVHRFHETDHLHGIHVVHHGLYPDF